MQNLGCACHLFDCGAGHCLIEKGATLAVCKQITPFVLCGDLDRAVAFYSDVLGFDLGFRADNYAFLRREGAALRLLECPPRDDGRPLGHEHSFYIDVDGIDALFAALKPALDGLPNGRVRATFDQPYGQREFHVLDEDGALVFFGQGIAPDGS